MDAVWKRDTGYRYYEKGDIDEIREKHFREAKPYTEHSIEEVRKMPVWAATVWKKYYVLYVSTNGETQIDEDGILPDGMECLFVNKIDGSIRIGRSARSAHYFIDTLREHLPTHAMDFVPYDNLKVG